MMQLSTKGRYATRIMVSMALDQGDRPVKKGTLAGREGISPDYTEQILMRLKARGLVVSHRGAGGGFTLSKPADEITVGDVLGAAEGPIHVTPCASSTCERESECVTRHVWRRAEAALAEVFEGVTIGELARDAARLREESVQTYAI